MVQSLENIPLDIHFARFVAGLAENDGEDIYLAALLTSLATRAGASCLNLHEWGGQQFQLADGSIMKAPSAEIWGEILRGSPVVGAGDGSEPLVLESDRVYLRRYWEYEQEVADALRRRGEADDYPLDHAALAQGLKRLFPSREEHPDWQRLAGLAVFLRSLVVIAGGPGTGKTTTIAQVLALLVEQYRLRGEKFRIALVAPTGKAALRLQETVAGLKIRLGIPSEKERGIPDQVMTIHRLLGVIEGAPFFRHDARNPLPYDLVVVDEASMVDLPLMAKLLKALSPSCRLVLLGDRHQLASVEPGSVLGDICHPRGLTAFSGNFIKAAKLVGERLAALPDKDESGRLCDSLVELKRSRRFGAGSGIALLSRAIRDGDYPGVWNCLNDSEYPEVSWSEVATSVQLDNWLTDLARSENFSWLAGSDPREILESNNNFRVLCALRRGRFGAEQVSRRLAELLLSELATGAAESSMPGLPIMVLRNDYELQLYNGDSGVIWPADAKTADRRAYFPGPAGGLRGISPSRLPEFQTAYAMTVHKSQGSEFSRVALVLPDHFSPVLSRELLFTAVSRARERVVVCGRADILEQAIARVTGRTSGLRQKLWG